MNYVLVPLGNPGKEYEYTRHNAARVILKHVTLEGKHLSVFIPDTYMNESGKALREYLRYHDAVEPIIMYDDKDLPIGTFRIAFDRGDGGHNGLLSVMEALGRTDFVRIRIGIAPPDVDGRDVIPPHGAGVQKFVLGKMREEELKVLISIAPTVEQALLAIVTAGYHKAMEIFNAK